MAIDWLDADFSSANYDVVYSLDRAREKYEVRDLGNGWLVLNWDTEKFILKFAVLEFYQSNGDGSNVRTSVQFHGEGPTGALRECRHTYWGEDGYLFYPNGPLIAAAFKALSEFYGDLVSTTEPETKDE